jgi:hypothetical protein
MRSQPIRMLFRRATRPDPERQATPARASVQSGARHEGIAGIYSNVSNLESPTYRIYRIMSGSNPTLSANAKFSPSNRNHTQSINAYEFCT